jgi:hypothetical protein
MGKAVPVVSIVSLVPEFNPLNSELNFYSEPCARGVQADLSTHLRM